MAITLRRGTTPYLTAQVEDNIDLSSIRTAWLTITQNDTIVLDLTTADLTINEKNVSIRLTQDNTLALMAGVSAYIQLRLLTDSDIAYASQTEYVVVEEILKDGVIV